MSRPKILALCLDPPQMPGSGGEVRSYFFIKMLAEFGDLTLVSLGGPGGHHRVGADIAELCSRVIEPHEAWRQESRKPQSRLHSWLRALAVIVLPWRNDWKDFYNYCMQYIQDGSRETEPMFQWRKRLLQSTLRIQYKLGARFGNLPCGLELAYTDKFEAIKRLALNDLKEGGYDLVWYEHTHCYGFVKYLLGSLNASDRPKLACNGHNVEWLLFQRMSKLAVSKWGAEYARIQSRTLRRLEAEQFKACDIVFVCSDEDKAAGEDLTSETNFVVVGNGVDSNYFSPASMDKHAKCPTLLFTGSFGYEPNLDGLKYFLNDVFPLIQEQVPNCRFMFAGRDAQQAYNALGIVDEFVVCISSPDDIRPCFHEAWVFVVPLRSGGGTRLKILEAMSIECPVVSTIIGAEGIPAVEGRHLLLADSPAEFARQVVTLINDRSLRTHIAQVASGWVRENYDWEPLIEKASAELNTLFHP